MKKSLFAFSIAAIVFTVGFGWAKEVHIRSKSVKSASLNPHDPAWMTIPSVSVPLTRQTYVSPQGGGAVKELLVRSVHSDQEIYLHLEWGDKNKNSSFASSGKFSDGCAVQFPYKPESIPSPFMGTKGNPVNIWYWRAVAKEPARYAKAYADFYRQDAIENSVLFNDEQVQNLVAEGFGTLTLQSAQDIEGSGKWKDGRWSVVVKRKLESSSGAVLKKGSVVPIAFAVWNGSTQERDGVKSLSFWHFLVIGNSKVDSLSDPLEKGKRVFVRYGCETCHGEGGKGGIKNKNAQGGEVPAINKLADGFTEDEVKKVVREGRTSVPEDVSGPFPSLHMSNWDSIMSEDELNHLVKYLFSISSKSDEWKE